MINDFQSDNVYRGHPKILEAVHKLQMSQETIPAYGADKYTLDVLERIKEILGEQFDPHLVFSGTGANMVGLAQLTRQTDMMIMTKQAHAYRHEVGAIQAATHCAIEGIETLDGKLSICD